MGLRVEAVYLLRVLGLRSVQAFRLRVQGLRDTTHIHAHHIGGCQNYGPFLGTLNIRCLTINNRDRKRDHNFDNHPYAHVQHISI